MRSPASLVLLYASLLGVACATPQASSTAISQPGCPSKVSVANGGFESGKIAPWTPGYGPGGGDPVKASVVSPGFANSKYALQLDFSGGKNTFGYEVSQGLAGKVCFGYYYNVTFAYNWVNYAGPSNYCFFKIYTGYTGQENVTTHFSTNKPGWHVDSYVIRDEYSHCRPLGDTLFFNLDCWADNRNLTVPPFSLRLDNLSIQSLPYSPLPYPPTGGC